MIYITIDDNQITIPKHTNTNYSDYDLHIENTLTHKVVLYQGIINAADTADLNYVFNINTLLLSNNSEFQYTLKNKKNILETGMLRVGEFTPSESVSYEDENNTIVYNGE